MAAAATGTVSFGFSKKATNHQKLIAKDRTDEVAELETDYVTSLEGKQVVSTKPVEKKKEDYVIPMIETNRWRVLKRKPDDDEVETNPPSATPDADGEKREKSKTATAETAHNNGDIDSIAVKELIADAARQNDIWENVGKIDKDLKIPILMQNRVPDGFETDDKLDVSLRPDEPEEADYEAIPIEHFGVAMLRGMGWKDGEGIGKNKKVIAPVNAVLRPKGLGLGASAAVLNESRKKNNKHNNKSSKEDEELKLCKGAYCLIGSGKHTDLYGQVEGIDEDNARVVVKLTISGQSATLSQHSIKLVDKHEYQKYSKYINKGKADKYKEKQQEKLRMSDDEKRDRNTKSYSESGSESDSSEKHRRKQSKKKRKHKHKDDDRHRHEDRKKESRKRKYEEEEHISESKKTPKSSPDSKLWVQSQLRVRIIDKYYKKGKYYNAKVEVVDVIDKNNCICKYEGKLLEELPQSSLETVVPKSHPSHVKIVHGSYCGQLGEIIERDKGKETCTVQLLSNRDKALTLHLDNICEYLGDIDTLMDY
ncbi:G-patch domain and KOW motifs-containing protein-like [Tubulanus polymorphus]|uniref:G-patch domain and KOW motifs-containing protein-like n=1 Tax=Tubulanus polymorphus TaxID=672921 RepID=UPI003DA63C1B